MDNDGINNDLSLNDTLKKDRPWYFVRKIVVVELDKKYALVNTNN